MRICRLGYRDKNHNNVSKVLHEVQVEELHNDCWVPFWHDLQVCVKGVNGRASCQGDSGGPLFPVDRNNKAVCVYGIISFGPGKCTEASIYTRVSGYEKWIDYYVKRG